MPRIIYIFLLTILSLPAFSAPQQKHSDSIYFLSLADIHFDPFISCYGTKKKPCPLIQALRESPVNKWPTILAANDKTLPTYRLDTNYSLLTSTLAAAKQAADADHVTFVLVLGDFIGHDFRKYYRRYARDPSHQGYQVFIDKTLQFVSNEIAKTFPNANIYPVVGNNDTYSRDYATQVGGKFFEDAARTWAPFIKNNANRLSMQKTFPYAGYYAVNQTEQGLKIIVLNSVLFSYKAKGTGVKEAANRQLAWLQKELESAKKNHQKVIVAMHIPVGIDVYATLRFKLFTLIELWKPEYAKRFKADIQDDRQEVAGVFSGHLHSDWFQIMTVGDGKEIALTGTPAVSPIFGNNPGFKLYKYSLNNKQISDYYTYYYPMEEKRQWGLEYEFNRVYQPNCHLCSLIDGMKKLQLTGDTAKQYVKYFTVSAETDLLPIRTHWDPYYWCFTREIGAREYKSCIQNS